jgi:hypothetical protein
LRLCRQMRRDLIDFKSSRWADNQGLTPNNFCGYR